MHLNDHDRQTSQRTIWVYICGKRMVCDDWHVSNLAVHAADRIPDEQTIRMHAERCGLDCAWLFAVQPIHSVDRIEVYNFGPSGHYLYESLVEIAETPEVFSRVIQAVKEFLAYERDMRSRADEQ